jgi:hypothetical protein
LKIFQLIKKSPFSPLPVVANLDPDDVAIQGLLARHAITAVPGIFRHAVQTSTLRMERCWARLTANQAATCQTQQTKSPS